MAAGHLSTEHSLIAFLPLIVQCTELKLVNGRSCVRHFGRVTRILAEVPLVVIHQSKRHKFSSVLERPCTFGDSVCEWRTKEQMIQHQQYRFALP